MAALARYPFVEAALAELDVADVERFYAGVSAFHDRHIAADAGPAALIPAIYDEATRRRAAGDVTAPAWQALGDHLEVRVAADVW